jgi:hypothetical protein
MKLDVAGPVRSPSAGLNVGGYERTTPSVAFDPAMRPDVNRAGEEVGGRDPRVDRERGAGASAYAADLLIVLITSGCK